MDGFRLLVHNSREFEQLLGLRVTESQAHQESTLYDRQKPLPLERRLLKHRIRFPDDTARQILSLGRIAHFAVTAWLFFWEAVRARRDSSRFAQPGASTACLKGRRTP
jgi:hypothetical protein